MRIKDTRNNQIFEVSDAYGSKVKYRFKKKCNAIERIKNDYSKKGINLQLYFLTVTLSNKNVGASNKELSRFINFLYQRFKRSGLPFYYLWVLELQEKRYYKYGVRAKHWHFAILAPVGSLPDVNYFKKYPHYRLKSDGFVINGKDLYKYWSYGQVLCQKALRQSNIFGYLGKYLGKNLDYKEFGSRSLGASRFGYYEYPEWAFKSIEKIKSWGVYLSLRVRKFGSRIDIKGFDLQGQPAPLLTIHSPYEVLTLYDDLI